MPDAIGGHGLPNSMRSRQSPPFLRGVQSDFEMRKKGVGEAALLFSHS